MKSPIDGRKIELLDEVTSTQDFASKLVLQDEPVGAVLANYQLNGRGRFSRNWISEPGDSLLSSTIMWAYADHPKPYLLGMAMSIAVAGAIHARLQWPNDIVIHGKKVGGTITEIVQDRNGRKIAIIGLGINLNQEHFSSEIKDRATSLRLEFGKTFQPAEVYRSVIQRLILLPEPEVWEAIQPAWDIFDETAGKKYKMANGVEVTAVGIGSEGQLIASNQGESEIIYAADALFGKQ